MVIEPVDRFIVSRVDRIVCVSEKVSQEVKERYGRESIVVYPGVDTKFFSQTALSSSPIDEVPDYAQVLLQVGQIRDEKCQAFTLRLFEKLCKYSDRLYLQFIGEGAVDSLQIPYSLSRRVLFSSSMPKELLSVYYRRATMLIYPSSWGEGCTLVPLEAIAAGCRCIAVCEGCGVDELVGKHLLGGVIFRTDFELEALAKKLSEPLLSLDRATQSDISFIDRERFANQYIDLFSAPRSFQKQVQQLG
jgi:glycosyltransferase involved in cell wall biosynthesis